MPGSIVVPSIQILPSEPMRPLFWKLVLLTPLPATWGICQEPAPPVVQAPAAATTPAAATAAKPQLPALEEARTRARLLHSSFSATLDAVHRDFFRKNESRVIPSQSLEEVFKTMEKEWGITLRWLAADATVMNTDHKAKDDFQKSALLRITAGEKEVIAVENNVLRFAGSITLRNECLKCHVRDRQSLEDRFSALEIQMAIQSDPPVKAP